MGLRMGFSRIGITATLFVFTSFLGCSPGELISNDDVETGLWWA